MKMPSFRKAKKDDAEVSTTTAKVPRAGVLGKMGLKKKSKVVVTEEPKPEPVEEPVKEEAPAEEPVAEEPAEEPVEEREEEPAEEPAEETPEEPVEEPAEEVEEREQPDEPVSTGFLCGCGV